MAIRAPCYRDVSSFDAMLLLDKQGMFSRSSIVTLRSPSERQSSSRSKALVHLAHAALFPSAIVGEFPGGERAAICPPVKREETRARVSKREERTLERSYFGGNNRAMCRLNCLGPNERAGNRRRIRCHVTFPYIPGRDGCIACLLDRSIPREEGERAVSSRYIPFDFISLYEIPSRSLLDNHMTAIFSPNILTIDKL